MKVRLPKDAPTSIEDSRDIFKIMHAVLMRQNRFHRRKEYFWTIGLNPASDIAYIELASIGKLNKAQLDPVEVFNFCVVKKCKRIIFVHNHPSGVIKPSKSDFLMTREFMKGAKYLDIRIEDHLIITDENGYYSMRDEDTLPAVRV